MALKFPIMDDKADELVMRGARVSVVMLLTLLSQNILISVSDRLTPLCPYLFLENVQLMSMG